MPDVPPTTGHRTARGSIDPSYFEAVFAADPDPWGFETSLYEADKYRATLDALPNERYARALEVGCAGGVLTAHLADRCAALVAVDVASGALDAAQRRLGNRPFVEVRRAVVPDETPEGSFDLVVVSEVGYYLSVADLARFERQLSERVVPGGHVVLVHWTGPTDYPLSADDVHAAFGEWTPLSSRRTDDYRLDVVARPS